MSPLLHSLTFPGSLLGRGFWLYVWEITTADGDVVLYVGRTGDEASPNAQSPFNRVSRHLGYNKHQNALRRNLLNKGIDPGACQSFEMIAHGPIFAETKTMVQHIPPRDKMAAMEKTLRDALADAGYAVLNKVNCKRTLDTELWREVRAAFSERFPELCESARAAITGEL